MLSDIEIANAATLRPIRDVASETLGIEERHLVVDWLEDRPLEVR